MLALLLLTALLHPYKAQSENRVNIFFLLMIIFVIISCMSGHMANTGAVKFRGTANFIQGLSVCIPVVYIVAIILYKLFGHRLWVRKLYQKLCNVCLTKSIEDCERTLPERMFNVEECAVLLADPMQVSEFEE